MASREITYNKQHFSIAYDILNPHHDKTLLFLHGWGSNKEIMKQAFSNHFLTYKHLYVDMPGFGKSPNEQTLTTQTYSTIMIRLLEELSIKADTIIGHSFGGKVATLMHPSKLILLSSAGIVMPKPFKVRTKIALFKLLKPLGLQKLRRLFVSKDVLGMNEGMYQTFKNVVDEDFSDNFQAYQNPTLLFWGKEDSATTLKAGEKMASLIPNSHFYPLEGDHFFFLKHADTIEKITMKVFDGTH